MVAATEFRFDLFGDICSIDGLTDPEDGFARQNAFAYSRGMTPAAAALDPRCLHELGGVPCTGEISGMCQVELEVPSGILVDHKRGWWVPSLHTHVITYEPYVFLKQSYDLADSYCAEAGLEWTLMPFSPWNPGECFLATFMPREAWDRVEPDMLRETAELHLIARG